MLFTRSRTNPVFYEEELRRQLADQPERLRQALEEPANADFLTWNVFMSLDTHSDAPWLAHVLQLVGGSAVGPPVRISLWSGRHRQPLLRPSPAYLRFIEQRAETAGAQECSLELFSTPVEVPVRLESPDVLALIDTTITAAPLGIGGRDRLVELVDAGIEHARRLSKSLTVAMVYAEDTPAGRDVAARVDELATPARLAAALPWRERLPVVTILGVTWRELLDRWQEEQTYLAVGGEPVRGFLSHCAKHGLRR
ncbi:MAG: hypothetical protein ACR2MA_10630 [Egibacteraceae bacterium]